MSVPNMRHVAFGLAAAAVLAAGLLTAVGSGRHEAVLQAAVPATSKTQPADGGDSGVGIHAPGAAVNVDSARGKVTVRAPHTGVDVDQNSGRVKVRAPYVNLDISW
jgi:phage baseplate assembly protein gpV